MNTQSRQIDQARGTLLRLDKNQNQVKRTIYKTARKRLVGGFILLIGLLALIGFILFRNQFVAVIATAGLLIGGLMFIKAKVRISKAHKAMEALTDRVVNEKAKLAELLIQLPIAE
jgi:hypothetical protein